MVVRVLKNSHHVQGVVDSDYESDGDDGRCVCKNAVNLFNTHYISRYLYKFETILEFQQNG